jgi:hypothetical protein
MTYKDIVLGLILICVMLSIGVDLQILESHTPVSYDDQEYYQSMKCDEEFSSLMPDQLHELEKCNTDSECADMAISLGVSRECVE